MNSVEEALRGLKLNFRKENVNKSAIKMNRTFKTRQAVYRTDITLRCVLVTIVSVQKQ